MTDRILLGAALLPFLGYAGHDQWLHLRARRVPIAENLLHLVLGIVLAWTILRAFAFDVRSVVFGVATFALAGALDEFVFHRRIPAEESDTHAKEHFALFVFFAAFALLVWRRSA